MKPILLLALLAGLCAPLPAKSLRKPVVVAQVSQDTLRVGGAVLTFAVADNDSERTQGLSGRKSMPWDEGLLFVFPNAQRRAFWMIDCHFDLDIAYISPNGIIRDIQAMPIQPGVAPEQLARYPSATNDIMYALEVNRGWFAARGLKVGDRLPAVLRHRTSR